MSEPLHSEPPKPDNPSSQSDEIPAAKPATTTDEGGVITSSEVSSSSVARADGAEPHELVSTNFNHDSKKAVAVCSEIDMPIPHIPHSSEPPAPIAATTVQYRTINSGTSKVSGAKNVNNVESREAAEEEDSSSSSVEGEGRNENDTCSVRALS